MKGKRKALAVWKVILITISSIIALVGVTILVQYLRGELSDKPVYPESGIFFVTDNEKYDVSSGEMKTAEDFYLTLSTATEDVNRKNVKLELSAGTNSLRRENGYIDNGIIRVPETVQLDKAFKVELLRSPEDSFIMGGRTTITATSTSYSPIDPAVISVSVDVPVDSITAFCYDAEDASMEALDNVFIGSHFKVGVNFTPTRSEKVFSSNENKYVFYTTSTNNIEFDYLTKTFHAKSVSVGEDDNDDITVYVFSNSQYQKEFLATLSKPVEELETASELKQFNEDALNYMNSHEGSFRSFTIADIVVKEVSVGSFMISGETFTANVDKNFHLALNSTLEEFDGNMGVEIRDEEGGILNSIYSGNVGIALDGTLGDADFRISGDVLKVEILADKIEENDEISYSFNYENGKLKDATVTKLSSLEDIDSFEPTYEDVTLEGDVEKTKITYYFFLPTQNVGEAGNYNYTISSNAEISVDFKVALFLEKGGEYELFLASGQRMETLPHMNITFTKSVEEEIYWKEDGTLSIVYDSDSHLSDSVEISQYAVVPSGNVYQTVRYFLMFENGANIGEVGNFTSIDFVSAYVYENGVDFNMPNIPGGGSQDNRVTLYELGTTNLTSKAGYANTVYLVFATVRTNADGEVIKNGDKYEIMKISSPKSLELDETIPISSFSTSLTLTSGVDRDYLDENDGILLPSKLTENDEFTFNITVDGDTSKRDQLLNLFNASADDESGYLRIEFRENDTGDVAEYIVVSNELTVSNNGISGDIVVYDSFSNIEGIALTPYLVYNNGKRVQETPIQINYNGAKDSFVLYKQSVNSAQYAFSSMEGVLAPDSEDMAISVDISIEGTKIIWPGNEELNGYDDLNSRLSVILYDTKGKVIRTNVATYTLAENPIDGEKVMTITNNEIKQFNSTSSLDGVTTRLYATYQNAGSSQSASLDGIYFKVKSEGVSKVEYSTSDSAGDTTSIGTLENLSEGVIEIEKYLVTDDFVKMNDLVKVYRRDVNDPDGHLQINDLSFTLNQEEMVGYGSDDLDSLFLISGETTEENIKNGIIKLGNEATATMDSETITSGLMNEHLVQNYTDSIYSFYMISALATDVRLVFDITDASGIVNLTLKLTLKQNIEWSPNFEAYATENGYADYLISGEEKEIRIFGAEENLDLNTYLPIRYIKNAQVDENGETKNATWNGNLYVESDTNIVVEKNDTTSYISFKDVTSQQIGKATFSFKGYNPYGLNVEITFLLTPNYAFVQNNDYVDLYSLSGDRINLDTKYSLYRATDLIDYIRSGAQGNAPGRLNGSQIAYTSGDYIAVSEENAGSIVRTEKNYVNTLGAVREDSISLIVNNGTNESAYAIIFKVEDGKYVLVDEERKYVNELPFYIGYGEEKGAQKLIDEIIDNNENYKLLATQNGYELVLLSGQFSPNEYKLVEGWLYEYNGAGLVETDKNDSLSTQTLDTNFNLGGDLTLKFSTNISNNKSVTDSISLTLRITKIGLEYVVYSENNDGDDVVYDYDIITGDAVALENANVFEEVTAGQTVKILYIGDMDEKLFGFHILDNEGITYNLQVERVTLGYEDLITPTKYDALSEITDAIKINSMIDIETDVYAVLKLTLTMQGVGGQQFSEYIYYRIKVAPNYDFEGDVTYPYNDSKEYLETNDSLLEVNFEEKFTSQNASNEVVGKTRFPSVIDKDGNVVEGLKYLYAIESVTVNGQNYANYEEYISLSFDENGVLRGVLTEKGDGAVIEVKVARTIENVANSRKVYTLLINNTPSYSPTIVNRAGGDLDRLVKDDNGNFSDNVTISTEYVYQVTLLRDEGDVQTPVTSGVNAHLTTDNAEKYLKYFIDIPNEGLVVFSASGETLTLQNDDADSYIGVTFEALQEDIVLGGVTIDKATYSRVTTTSADGAEATYYVPTKNIVNLTFKASGAEYILTFHTKDSIDKDSSFSIGIYTEYANIFDITFNIDGGYDIDFEDLSGKFKSGDDYAISKFIQEIVKKSGGDDIKNDFEYVVKAVSIDGENVEATGHYAVIENVNGINYLRTAKHNKDFTVTIEATIEEGDTPYSFTFDVNFSKAFNNETIEKDATSEIMAQATRELSVESGDIRDAILSVFNERLLNYTSADELASLGGVDAFTFEGGGSTYALKTTNVPEKQNFVLTLAMEYRFNGNVIFTFNIRYNYTVSPNVSLSFNYPNPENLEATTFTSEYVDNGEILEDFFNSKPKFARSDVGSRVVVEKLGEGDCTYEIAVSVDEIDNVKLSVNENITLESVGEVGKGLEFDLKFELIDTGRVGKVVFSIVANSVTDYYYVTVNNQNSVTVERNATNLVENNYERIYVEDISKFDDTHLFTQNRMLKYQFASGASGQYYVRFDKQNSEPLIEYLSVQETGIEYVVDLGASYEGYSFRGVYYNKSNADNAENAVTNLESVFTVVPYLTERIVIKFAGKEISNEIAKIHLGDSPMEEVDLGDTTDSVDTMAIKYALTDDNIVDVNATYSTLLTVKFDVETSIQNHYATIYAGQKNDLLSMGFGIINSATGEDYSASEIENNNAHLNLQLYGFSDNKVEDNEEVLALHNALTNGTASVASGERFETGLNPRYEMNLDSTSGDSSQNYLELTYEGQTSAPNNPINYTLSAQGATNNGNFVALKLTYIVKVGTKEYSKSADILVKIMPAYRVEFSTKSGESGVSYGDNIVLNDVVYCTNSSNNPFTIASVNTGNNTYNIYGENSVVRVYRTNGQNNTALDSVNLSNKFTYSFTVNGTSGFNRYDDQGLSLGGSWNYSSNVYTANSSKNASLISFLAKAISLGQRAYYFDAVDNFGFKIRFYFVIKAQMNPEIQGVSTRDVAEGGVIQIGAQYRQVEIEGGIAKADGGDSQPQFPYDYAYNINISPTATNAPSITLTNANGGNMASALDMLEIRYGYENSSGDTLLTEDFEVARQSSTGTVTLYIRTAGISEGASDMVLTVTYYNTTLEPIHSDGEFKEPNFSSHGGVDVTLSGFESYMFTKTEGSDVVPYIASCNAYGEHVSNVNNVTIQSITFEYNGEKIEATGSYNSEQAVAGQTDKTPSNSLITTDSYYMLSSSKGLITGYNSIPQTSDNYEDILRIPTLPGYFYGTSDVVENVDMVITLVDGNNNTAELRESLNIQRKQNTQLTKTEYKDTESVNGSSFTGGGSVHNDTLEVRMAPGASVSFDISHNSKTRQVSITNNFNYEHTEYVRISTVKDESVMGEYEINVTNVSGEVDFIYGGVSVIESATENSSGNITLSTTLSTINSRPLILRIESADELNSQHYTTRDFFTIILENGKYYQNNHIVTLRTLTDSITTTEVTVSNYYEVETTNGSYYVIPVSSWAQNLSYSPSLSGSTIASKPYYYSYTLSGQTARGASVDAMGTITTGTNFNIQSYYVEVAVVLHVAGADGLFEDRKGINIGTVKIRLSDGTRSGSKTGEGVYLGNNAVIALNEGEKLYGRGSYSAPTSEVGTPSSKTIVVPVNEEIVFTDYIFDSTCTNVSYRVLKAGSGESYDNSNNEDSYVYERTGEYNGVLVESGVSEGGSITYKLINVKTIVFNENAPSEKAIAVKTNETKSLESLFDSPENVYLAEDVAEGVFAEGEQFNGTSIATLNLSSTTSKMEAIDLVEVNAGVTTYYKVSILFYDEENNFNVALTSKTSYTLSSLLGEGNIYVIDSQNQLVETRYESLMNTAPSVVEKTYYVVGDNSVTQNVVNYYIHKTQSEGNIVWYDDVVSKEEIIASIEAQIGEIDTDYTLYKLSANKEMTEVGDELEIAENTLSNNRANIKFLLDANGAYTVFDFTFYHYSGAVRLNVDTFYTRGYPLSQLNAEVTEALKIDHVTGSIVWYVFENGDVHDVSTVELSENDAVDNVVTREFYVRINSSYYLVTVNFTCSAPLNTQSSLATGESV